jgi:hypothetical protein
MHIFIDESGPFAETREPGSYCAVAAYVIPEPQRKVAEEALRQFKLRSGKSAFEEVKARDVTEDDYFFLLEQLRKVQGIVIAIVTDASMNTNTANHKEQQAKKVDEWAPQMIHAEGKAMVHKVAADIRKLSNQNYVELHCRANLVWDVVRRATLYFVQRSPATLGHFRWNFDQKDLRKTHFESTMADLLGILSQSISARTPLAMLEGADYSHFKRFEDEGGDISWFPGPHDNITQVKAALYREHLRFVDSKACPGIQIADLIVNGITRCLRGRFKDNDRAAELLGRLMVGVEDHAPSVQFVMFSQDGPDRLQGDVARRVEIMANNSRNMVVRED